MTVTFREYRHRMLSHDDQRAVKKILTTLDSRNSYHADLQLLYNNADHFTTVNFSICTREQLQDIARAARSRTEIIEVQGDVHENFHVSGVVRNAFTNKGLPVYDSYIRVKFRGHLYHVLLHPPRLAAYEYFSVMMMHGCEPPSRIIPPIIQPPAL